MTRTISQTEFLDQSDRVLEALRAGEDFIITQNGEPVGEERIGD